MSITVTELIEKLQNLPEEFKDAIICVGHEDEDGEGNFTYMNKLCMNDATEQDEVEYPAHVDLYSSDFDE